MKRKVDKNKINTEDFETHFPKEWIDDLECKFLEVVENSSIKKTINSSNNKGWWPYPGKKFGRTTKKVGKEVNEYFKEMLAYGNIGILSYVVKNIEEFQSLKFLDYGSGLGILSVFLKKLGIECYNYDNFSQLLNEDQDINDLKVQKSFLDFYQIPPPSNILPKEPIDVIICSGIWIHNNNNLIKRGKNREYKYLIFDSLYEKKNRDFIYISNINSNYSLYSKLKGIINVYKKDD